MRSTTLLALAALLLVCSLGELTGQAWSLLDPDVRSMTMALSVQERIGQMTQLDIKVFLVNGTIDLDEDALAVAIDQYGIGSLLNTPTLLNDFPALSVQGWRSLMTRVQTIAAMHGPRIPILYGLDSVHGAGFVAGATLFPHQIGLAATFNVDLVREAYSIQAKDTRSCGIHWAFSPIMDVSLQKTWPRVYETFGECPYLASQMGRQAIFGMQGYNKSELASSTRVASSMKHFVGYSNPRSGLDRTQAWIPLRVLRQYFLKSFQEGINAGGATIMETYGDINGIPVASSEFYLKKLIRDEMGFQGLLVTDYNEINNLHSWHHVAASKREAIRIAMSKTTIDMSMVATDFSFNLNMNGLIENKDIDIDRVTLSCGRALQLKKNLGLFDNPMPTDNAAQVSSVGSDQDRELSRNVVRESITMLKNEPCQSRTICESSAPILPLGSSSPIRILVTGPSSNSIKLLNSGWTMHWQGAVSDSEFAFGSTIASALGDLAKGTQVIVEHFDGCNLDNCSVPMHEATVTAASLADIVIVCLSEGTYAEKPGNIYDLSLDADQIQLVESLHASGKPIVSILTMGRPRLLGSIVKLSSAILHAYFPGSEGGQVIAEILMGRVNPSGRLPFTWPRHSGDMNTPYWHSYSSEDTFDPEFEFGFGLSYSKFVYSSLSLSKRLLTPGESLHVHVKVANTGHMDGKEAVLLFFSSNYRSVSPEVKLLKRFKKVIIPQQSSKIVEFTLETSDFEFFGVDDSPIPMVESGLYVISIGDQQALFEFEVKSPIADLQSNPSSSSMVNHISVIVALSIMGNIFALFIVVRRYWPAALKFGRSDYRALVEQPSVSE